jgi:hypothetical protein
MKILLLSIATLCAVIFVVAAVVLVDEVLHRGELDQYPTFDTPYTMGLYGPIPPSAHPTNPINEEH